MRRCGLENRGGSDSGEDGDKDDAAANDDDGVMLSIFVIAVMAVVWASTSKMILISAMPECCTRMSPEIRRHLHFACASNGLPIRDSAPSLVQLHDHDRPCPLPWREKSQEYPLQQAESLAHFYTAHLPSLQFFPCPEGLSHVYDSTI